MKETDYSDLVTKYLLMEFQFFSSHQAELISTQYKYSGCFWNNVGKW